MAFQEDPTKLRFFYKTALCKYYLVGLCVRHDNCTHAHSLAELRPRPDLSKTVYCSNLKMYGVCAKGATCSFAHSRKELRNVHLNDRAELGSFAAYDWRIPAGHSSMLGNTRMDSSPLSTLTDSAAPTEGSEYMLDILTSLCAD